MLRATALFALIVGAGAWPSAEIAEGFSRLVSGAGNVALAFARLPADARLELRPSGSLAPPPADHHVGTDTQLIIRVPGHRSAAFLGISLRRDAYLPLVIFFAATAVMPISRPQKAFCLAMGLPIVFIAALAAVWLLAAQVVQKTLGADPGGLPSAFGTFVFERWLIPPGNRVVTPLIFAAILAYGLRRCSKATDPRRGNASLS